MPGDFFDSNILLYLSSADAAKSNRAADLLEIGGTIRVQVLNEIANVSRKKLRLDWPVLNERLERLREILRVVPISIETHMTGLALAERYGFAFYDSLVVAAAKLECCSCVWREDMQHGLQIEDGPRIVNPFRAD